MSNTNHENTGQLTTYEIKEKKLLLKISDEDSIKEIQFDFPVRQVVKFSNTILIRIEPDIGKILNENVYCYSLKGVFLWQIKPTDTIDADCPYTNIVISDGKLFCYNWSGEKIFIDPNHGEILKKEFTK